MDITGYDEAGRPMVGDRMAVCEVCDELVDAHGGTFTATRCAEDADVFAARTLSQDALVSAAHEALALDDEA